MITFYSFVIQNQKYISENVLPFQNDTNYKYKKQKTITHDLMHIKYIYILIRIIIRQKQMQNVRSDRFVEMLTVRGIYALKKTNTHTCFYNRITRQNHYT